MRDSIVPASANAFLIDASEDGRRSKTGIKTGRSFTLPCSTCIKWSVSPLRNTWSGDCAVTVVTSNPTTSAASAGKQHHPLHRSSSLWVLAFNQESRIELTVQNRPLEPAFCRDAVVNRYCRSECGFGSPRDRGGEPSGRRGGGGVGDRSRDRHDSRQQGPLPARSREFADELQAI